MPIGREERVDEASSRRQEYQDYMLIRDLSGQASVISLPVQFCIKIVCGQFNKPSDSN